jgi:hypothetical protein
MKTPLIIIGFLLLGTINIQAQNPDSVKANAIKIWGFADFYYAYDFNEPGDHNRPGFIYSHNRHNEFALNNAILGLEFNKEKVRAALALHTGTYVRANYAAEPDLLRLIYEANAGFRLTSQVWIEAGVFSSHIGAESAISSDNFILSRSMMADNTPYYESGVKATYTPNEKLTITGLVLNGWQNIVENNNNKALGTQFRFRPVKNILFNSSTFFGKEKAAYDTLASMRYFHNFYTQIDIKKISILTCFDIGLQERRHRSGVSIWYNPNLIIRYTASEKLSIAIRTEYYHDKSGIIIYSHTVNGFQTFSSSLNFDYRFSENIVWRVEGRFFQSKDKVFVQGNEIINNNVFALSSLAVKF